MPAVRQCFLALSVGSCSCLAKFWPGAQVIGDVMGLHM